MINHKQLRPGTRVELRGEPVGVTLRSLTGIVVGPDRLWEGYSIVRLDEPAIYHHPDGRDEDLAEIREADDNLDILPMES